MPVFNPIAVTGKAYIYHPIYDVYLTEDEAHKVSEGSGELLSDERDAKTGELLSSKRRQNTRGLLVVKRERRGAWVLSLSDLRLERSEMQRLQKTLHQKRPPVLVRWSKTCLYDLSGKTKGDILLIQTRRLNEWRRRIAEL